METLFYYTVTINILYKCVRHVIYHLRKKSYIEYINFMYKTHTNE